MEDYIAHNSTENKWRCLICQREFNRRNNAKRHIELKHFENQPEQCYICLKWMKNSVSLKVHIRSSHKSGL